MIVDEILDRQSLFLLQVANGDKLHIVVFDDPAEVVHAAMLDTDGTDNDLLAGRHGTAFAQCGSWHEIRHGCQGAGSGPPVLRNRRRERDDLLGMIVLLQEDWRAGGA